MIKDTLTQALNTEDAQQATALIMDDFDLLNSTDLFDDIKSVDELKDEQTGEGFDVVDADYNGVDLDNADQTYYYVSQNGIDELQIAPVDQSIFATIKEALANA